MKKLIPLFVALATIIISCSKKTSSDPGPDNKPPVAEAPYNLLTLNFSFDNFDSYSSTYFVLTDENGEII
ncbi:MAG: hypothetical protein AAGC65_11370, partial [Mucilaginibacter sp.]|uniref:hypothetical protein n=1 Tax=Mucilaginibacter sp. TaxID=1882438 RepID=UPI0031AFCDBB